MNTMTLFKRFSLRVLFGMVVALNASLINIWAGESSSAIGEIIVPKDGTAAERAKILWQTIRPIILADAKAPLTDAECLDRRSLAAT